MAYVVRKAGATIDAEDVLSRRRSKVASFNLPRHVVFVEAFPMIESG